MTELKMEHILMFAIVAFVLYLLGSYGNGFSVGSSCICARTKPDDLDNCYWGKLDKDGKFINARTSIKNCNSYNKVACDSSHYCKWEELNYSQKNKRICNPGDADRPKKEDIGVGAFNEYNNTPRLEPQRGDINNKNNCYNCTEPGTTNNCYKCKENYEFNHHIIDGSKKWRCQVDPINIRRISDEQHIKDIAKLFIFGG
jgi:hypothetical protein